MASRFVFGVKVLTDFDGRWRLLWGRSADYADVSYGREIDDSSQATRMTARGRVGPAGRPLSSADERTKNMPVRKRWGFSAFSNRDSLFSTAKMR